MLYRLPCVYQTILRTYFTSKSTLVHYRFELHMCVVLSKLIRFMRQAVDGKADRKLRKFPDRNFQLTEMASKWFDINLRKLLRKFE